MNVKKLARYRIRYTDKGFCIQVKTLFFWYWLVWPDNGIKYNQFKRRLFLDTDYYPTGCGNAYSWPTFKDAENYVLYTVQPILEEQLLEQQRQEEAEAAEKKKAKETMPKGTGFFKLKRWEIK